MCRELGGAGHKFAILGVLLFPVYGYGDGLLHFIACYLPNPFFPGTPLGGSLLN
jgi:hypothetical protein